ncbi:hypothetical protein RND81_03G051800 [Saponaria officinalis]|uniref:S-protein homolog n=1 Tax=Saponaria officinalis TaxID=3572 RepID=A0AAW1M413_SAPOF
MNISTTNFLNNKPTLYIHCKDKHKDLGTYVVEWGETYKFEIYKSFWGRTWYYCGVKFDNILHRFDIFFQRRDDVFCDPDCYWIIKDDGPCSIYYRRHSNFTRCFPWK